MAISYPIDALARILCVKQPISPVRIRKLVRSTNIEPGVLRKEGYQYSYSLESAMIDWFNDRPKEWQ